VNLERHYDYELTTVNLRLWTYDSELTTVNLRLWTYGCELTTMNLWLYLEPLLVWDLSPPKLHHLISYHQTFLQILITEFFHEEPHTGNKGFETLGVQCNSLPHPLSFPKFITASEVLCEEYSLDFPPTCSRRSPLYAAVVCVIIINIGEEQWSCAYVRPFPHIKEDEQKAGRTNHTW
jgi:hypothetical protein